MPGTNLTRAEAEARATTVSTEAYVIELDLTTSEETFRSSSTVTFSATPGAETFIDLVAPEVLSITLNGEELDVATHFADSRITLPNLREHNELTVVANCAPRAPVNDAAKATTNASPMIIRRSCRGVAPISRSSPSSRRRDATANAKVLAITNTVMKPAIR